MHLFNFVYELLVRVLVYLLAISFAGFFVLFCFVFRLASPIHNSTFYLFFL